MRNLLSLVGLAVVLFLGVGWYCNWYTAKVQTGTDGKLNVSFDVDKKKMGQDVGAASDKLGRFVSAPAGGDQTAGAADPVGPPAAARTLPTGR